MKFTSLATLIVTAVLSSAAFADTADLNTFNILSNTGLTAEAGMGKLHFSAEPVQCSYSNQSGEYACDLVDTSMEASGQTVRVEGKVAQQLFDLLASFGATEDSGMGKFWLSIAYIHCQQTHEGVDPDSSAAARTHCEVEVGN